MTDDRPDDDEGRIEEPRSEGVRIIGAQEAAEAAGRPDVARRRRRGEKRFGDRPDEPDPAADLPTVRISTSEDAPAGGAGDRFGAVPVVPAPDAEPRWAEDDFAAMPDADAERTYGHARAVPADEPSAWEPAPEPGQPRWSDEPVDAGPDPFGFDPAGDLGAGDDAASEDDSFVLPHWTEPPTGQVPKVVIGDDPADAEPAAAYGSQPRWRDEGERTVETDFDDLLADAPRLGALGGGGARRVDEYDDEEEDADGFDFFEDEPAFEDASERDPLEAFAPDDRGFDDPAFDDERPAKRRMPSLRRGVEDGEEEIDLVDDDRPRRGGGGRDDGRSAGGGAAGGDRNLVVAVGVGVALVALGLLAFKLGGLATTILACVIVGMAAYEFFGAVEARGFHPAALLGLVATVGLLLGTYFSALDAYPVVLTLTVVLGLLWYLWVAPGDHSVRNLGITLLGVMWIGFLGSFGTLFLGLGKVLEDADPTTYTSNIGIGVLIAAVVASVSHDVGAYFVGRYAGKTPMSAASPNKTLEGLAGGVLTSIVVTFVVIGVVGVAPIGGDIFRVFVFALLCAVVAPLGDLCESFIKRDLGIKDMGSVLPGHGGVLDRFDALLFVLPTAYFVTILFDVWAG